MRGELWKIPAFILTVISISLLLSFISSVDLSDTGFSGFIGAGEGKARDVPTKTAPVSYAESKMSDLNQESNPPQVPVFFVEGLNEHTYLLRLYTSSNYKEGVWKEDKVSYNDKEAITGTTITRYSVTPLTNFSTHIPVAKDTHFVTASADFSAETGTYLVDNLSSPYTGYSSAHDFQAEKASPDGEEVNAYGEDEIRELTRRITQDAENDYEKAVLIKKYLQENYKYDTEHWTSPHPVYDFLFKEERGVCKHFASAFIIMSRTVDIPARGVFGYLAKPVSYNQTVYASQSHMWAEVNFEEGWMEFDPTPPPPEKIPTDTGIDVIDKTAQRGSNFTISGHVDSEEGTPTGYVEVFLKKEKNRDGILVDILSLKDGRFNHNVSVPDVSGEYHVVAHYVGSLRYKSSWSDPIIRIYDPANLEANIPNMTARECQITGSLHDYNGTAVENASITLETSKIEKDDNEIYFVNRTYKTETNSQGAFQFNISFREEGTYIVEVSYPGDDYTLPASIEKRVEVGDVQLYLNNTSAVRGEVWNTSGILYFNDRPLSSLIKFNRLTTSMAQDGEFNISTKIPSTFPLGNTQLNYTVSELNYRSSTSLTVKAHTNLDVEVNKDKNWVVVVHLTDDKGNPVSGEVSIANHTVYTQSGVAKMESDDLSKKFQVVFSGNEKYLSSSTTVDRSSFPYWIFALLIPVAAFATYKLRTQELIALDWGSDLPPIWDVGEEINIKVRLKNGGKGILRASLNGEGLDVGDFLDLEFVFQEPGKHTLVVERLLNGKVKESRQVEIKIMSYSEAIIDTFGELVKIAEEKKNLRLKDATAREVYDALGTSNGTELLDLFEYAKYGDERFTRDDFSTAYHAYLNVVGGIA